MANDTKKPKQLKIRYIWECLLMVENHIAAQNYGLAKKELRALTNKLETYGEAMMDYETHKQKST